jgi:hypothetical protein
MSPTIDDPISKTSARVDGNQRLEVHAVSQPEAKNQALVGDSFSINTESISITGASALLYVKNNNVTKDMHVEFITMGLDNSATAIIECIQNPDNGTLISGGSAVAIKANQNFGSPNTFPDVEALQGVDGSTITDGSNISYAFSSGRRTSFGASWVLPKGSRAAFRVTPTGATDAYISMVGYLEAPES